MLFGVLKVMDEVAEPLYKTVVVLYTRGEPLFVTPQGLMENTVRMKKTSVLLQAPEADPDWQDSKEMSNGEVTVGGDSDEDDNSI